MPYSPRCPQVNVDVRHLLRIPEDFTISPEAEDEFECLNLEVTCPPVSSAAGPLPVVIWIHGMHFFSPDNMCPGSNANIILHQGGSQVVTFCSAASKICGKFEKFHGCDKG